MSHLETLEQQRDELNRQAQELQRGINLKEYQMTTEVQVNTYPAQTIATWRTATTYETVFTHQQPGEEATRRPRPHHPTAIQRTIERHGPEDRYLAAVGA